MRVRICKGGVLETLPLGSFVELQAGWPMTCYGVVMKVLIQTQDSERSLPGNPKFPGHTSAPLTVCPKTSVQEEAVRLFPSLRWNWSLPQQPPMSTSRLVSVGSAQRRETVTSWASSLAQITIL